MDDDEILARFQDHPASDDEKRDALIEELERRDRGTLEKFAAMLEQLGRSTAAATVREIAERKPRTLH